MIWPMIVGAGVGIFIIFMIWLTNRFLYKKKIRKVPVIELSKQSLSENSAILGKKKKRHEHKHKKR